jgi:hypothetical protein
LNLKHEAVVYLKRAGRKKLEKIDNDSDVVKVRKKRGRKEKEPVPLSKRAKVDDKREKKSGRKAVSPRDTAKPSPRLQKLNNDKLKEGTIKGNGRGDAGKRYHGGDIVGSRVAVYWEKEGTFFKVGGRVVTWCMFLYMQLIIFIYILSQGKIKRFNNADEKHQIYYDDGEIAWLDLAEQEFRYIKPRTRTSGCSTRYLKAMEKLGCEQVKLASNADDVKNKSGLEGTKKPVEVISRRAPTEEQCVSWRLSIRAADKLWYLGEIIAYKASNGLHLVLYDDGEDEWVDLPNELIAWHCLSKDKKDPVFPGLDKSAEKPIQKHAIGWRVSVFWPHERSFFGGEIIGYDDEADTYQVSYHDGELSMINLAEDKVKWIAPPGSKYTRHQSMETVETSEDELEASDPDFEVQDALPIPAAGIRKGIQKRRGRKSMTKNSNRRLDTVKYSRRMPKRCTSSTPSLEESIVSRDRHVYDYEPQKMKGEPVVIRNIATSSGDLAIANGFCGGLYTNGTVPVRIFLSAPEELSLTSGQTKPEYREYDSDTRTKLQKLDLMISRIDRANECLLKGIPTYLPEVDSAPRRMREHFGDDTFENARKAVASKQLMRRKKYSMKQDFDSESDNFNNKAYGGELHQIGFTRFRRQNYAPYSASLKGLQPESSSASSSAEEAELDDYLYREKVTCPRVRFSKGGKVRPTSPGGEGMVQDYANEKESIMLPAQPTVPEPSVPEPITSPFDATPPNPMDENNNGLEIAMNDLPYSESVGNLLGIGSRNGSAVGFFLGEAQQQTTFDLS